jgi:hypothetical protein
MLLYKECRKKKERKKGKRNPGLSLQDRCEIRTPPICICILFFYFILFYFILFYFFGSSEIERRRRR